MKYRYAMLALFVSFPVLAAEATDSRYASVLMGESFGQRSGMGNSFVISGRIGRDVYRDETALALGAFIGTIGANATYGGVTASERDLAFMGEILARRAWGSGFYFGGRIGMAAVNLNVTGSGLDLSGSGTSLAYGAVLGYEASLSDSVNLNVEAFEFVARGGTIPMPPIGDINYDSARALITQVGIQFHW